MRTLQRRVQVAAHSLVHEATVAGLTCGCAESCTGGLVSSAITAIPGSSAVFLGGVVSYAPYIKHHVLGVNQQVLDDPSMGPVSKQCATQMCVGAARLLGCDISVSVTGIAGPSGEEPGKPVGTVWFGLWTGGSVKSLRRIFSGTREEVRLQATEEALWLIREAIVELSDTK